MIAETIERTVFTKVAPDVINYVHAVPYEQRSGLVAQVYNQMMDDFQLVPPVTVHSPAPKVLAGVWTAVRESLVAAPASRVEREAVVAAISRINTCPFCVDVHSIALHGAGEHDLAGAIVRGEDDKIDDPRTQALVQWAAATRTPGAEILHSPPFPRTDAAQIIGSALLFHYINREVNVFLDESPLMLPSLARPLKGIAKRIAGSVIGRRTLANTPAPGDSLQLLPDAPLPEEFRWAASNPYVAGAWARLNAVVEEAGEAVVPEGVRELILNHVKAWNGEDMGLSRHWVEDAIAGLQEEHKPVARLALLAALASHQVGEDVVENFRKYHPHDASLVATVAWGSFAATRRISQWLHLPAN